MNKADRHGRISFMWGDFVYEFNPTKTAAKKGTSYTKRKFEVGKGWTTLSSTCEEFREVASKHKETFG